MEQERRIPDRQRLGYFADAIHEIFDDETLHLTNTSRQGYEKDELAKVDRALWMVAEGFDSETVARQMDVPIAQVKGWISMAGGEAGLRG